MARLISRLHPVNLVVDKIDESLGPLWRKRVKLVDILDAVGMISAEEYKAVFDNPPRKKSVLDGYAVRSSDLAGASQFEPAVLRVAGKVEVGEVPPERLEPGSALKVATGAFIPDDADVVVPIEAARVEGSMVFIYKPYPPGYGVMQPGEDLAKGEVIVNAGERISWFHVALLASQGYRRVKVYELPSVAIFAVGNEVVEPGKPLPPGKIYDSTMPLLAAYLRSRGFRVTILGYAADDPNEIRERYEEGIAKADIVLAIGGSSVGEKDYTARVLDEIVGNGWCIHGLLLRPGRTGKFCVVGDKLLASLSGFPVAAWAQVYTVLERSVYQALGARWPPDPPLPVRLARRVASGAGLLDVIRVRVCSSTEGLKAEPLRVTGSGVLSTLLRGNAVLLVPEDSTGYEEGETITVYLLSRNIPPCRG